MQKKKLKIYELLKDHNKTINKTNIDRPHQEISKYNNLRHSLIQVFKRCNQNYSELRKLLMSYKFNFMVRDYIMRQKYNYEFAFIRSIEDYMLKFSKTKEEFVLFEEILDRMKLVI